MAGNNDSASRRILIAEGAIAFAALAAGTAFFGYSNENAPTVVEYVPTTVISQSVSEVEPVLPEPAEPVLSESAESVFSEIPDDEIENVPTSSRKNFVSRKSVYVSIDRVIDGSAVILARNAGADTITVDMKHDSGNLNWTSDLPLAKQLKTSSHRANINDILKEFLANEEFHTVARVSAFRDRIAGTENEYAVLNNRSQYWTDEKGIFWSSVRNSDIRNYIVSCAVELAELGFDEIMLENIAPESGRLDVMMTEERFADEAEQEFLALLRAVINKTDAYLSVKLDKNIFATEQPVNSLTADMITECFDYCWENTDGILKTVYCENFCGGL